jgi:hypothetical protein
MRRIVPKAKKVLSFKGFKECLLPINNSRGNFLLLPNRVNLSWVIDPNNWVSRIKHIDTEGRHGHMGVRRKESFEFRVKNPANGLVRHIILKPAQIPNKRFQELFGLVRFRDEARIITEVPLGICSMDGVWYTITLRSPGKTLKIIGGNANGSVVDAAKIYGRAFNAGLLQNDAGVKHFLASGKRLTLFDLEFATRAKNKKQGLNDFKSFFVNAVESGLVEDKAVALRIINVFCETTGLGQEEILALVKQGMQEKRKINADFGLVKKRFFGLFASGNERLSKLAEEL